MRWKAEGFNLFKDMYGNFVSYTSPPPDGGASPQGEAEYFPSDKL